MRVRSFQSGCVTVIDRLDVHIEIDGRAVRAGNAHFIQRRGGGVTTTFIYAATYLSDASARPIDPNLPLVSGQQVVSDRMPGSFQDCAPDRWGRNLILKRHRAATAGLAGRTATLNDVDFLAGVSDITRQGALRFTLPDSTDFIGTDADVPKMIALPRLLHAVDQLDTDDEQQASKALLDAGSGSLGGARPKASVIDPDGRLLLAKFPRRTDEWDVMAWEHTALDLAERAGIDVPARSLTGFENRHILLLDRFDRSEGRRIPYASAMTLTDSVDGDSHDYADIADSIEDVGDNVRADLAQLFRRAVLNCAIHNTDDHLRNHGFCGARAGWRLSPVFDINPNPDLNEDRVTSIGAAVSADEEPAGLMILAGECRMTAAQARTTIREVLEATAGWADVATSNGTKKRELEMFRPMFDERAATLQDVVRRSR